MKTAFSRRIRSVALLGVAALAVGSIGVLSTATSMTPAYAAPGDGGIGAITVHKFEKMAQDLGPNDGQKLSDVSGARPLSAGFTVSEVQGLRLTSAAEWRRLSSMAVRLDHAGVPVLEEGDTRLELVTIKEEQITDESSGSTTFEGLSGDRAYVVWESRRAVNALGLAEPVLLTVPFPGVDAADAWNYHPHIYPKDIVVGSGSTMKAHVADNEVAFTLTVPIQPLGGAHRYTGLDLQDSLPAALQYKSATVRLHARDGNVVALVADADYLMLAPHGAERVLTVRMLGPGLAKIDQALGGELVLEISAGAVASGTTANEARVTLNGVATAEGTGPRVLDPSHFFIGAHLRAWAKSVSGSSAPLHGAEFALYRAGAAACGDTAPAHENPVVAGLRSGKNGATPPVVLLAGDYCAYETSIPGGYKGLSGGVKFTVDRENASIDVENAQLGSEAGDLPSLPLTGSAGTVLFAAGGMFLVALGAGLASARKRARAGAA